MRRRPPRTITPESLQVDGRSLIRLREGVAMRDGVVLATDVYAAAADDLATPRPTLLERTPYGIRKQRFSDGLHADGRPVTPESGALYFVERGYVVVRQDCRGRGDSDGIFSKYTGEAADGVDTLEWIAAQPWSDGRIVTAGVSYSAHVQTAAASLGGPGVHAMILDSGGFASAYETGGRFGGAFELKQVIWAYRHALSSRAAANDPLLRANLEAQDLAGWFRALPWRKGLTPLSAIPEFEDFLFEQWTHEDLDEFWKQPGLYGHGHYDAFPDVPMLNISSWYDPYVRTAIDNFTAMRRRHGPRSWLVLGPWTHGARSRSYSGDVDFGSAATLDGNLAPDYLTFKHEWLRDALGPDGGASRSAVSYFVMGGGSGRRNADGRLEHGGAWRHADAWPPPEAIRSFLYLTDDLRLADEPPDGGALSFDFDPRDPVPTRGGAITSSEPLMQGGAFDQRPTGNGFGGLDPFPLAARRDVLTFQTLPLAHDVVLAGGVEVALLLSSTAPDTDIAVKLIDVHPPSPDYPLGFAMNVTDGMLRCRYRDGFHRPKLMEAGIIYPVTVAMPDTANLFAAGHRIRLDVTSSNFPRTDVNPNTGRPVAGDRTWQVARNTVHLGGSRLSLDVIV